MIPTMRKSCTEEMELLPAKRLCTEIPIVDQPVANEVPDSLLRTNDLPVTNERPQDLQCTVILVLIPNDESEAVQRSGTRRPDLEVQSLQRRIDRMNTVVAVLTTLVMIALAIYGVLKKSSSHNDHATGCKCQGHSVVTGCCG
ncbi:hypothetical protein B7463_g3496, partial [Scytalidium lignicola]